MYEVDLVYNKNYWTSFKGILFLNKRNLIPIKDKLYEVSFDQEKFGQILIIELLKGRILDLQIKFSIRLGNVHKIIMHIIANDSLESTDFYL